MTNLNDNATYEYYRKVLRNEYILDGFTVPVDQIYSIGDAGGKPLIVGEDVELVITEDFSEEKQKMVKKLQIFNWVLQGELKNLSYSLDNIYSIEDEKGNYLVVGEDALIVEKGEKVSSVLYKDADNPKVKVRTK